VKKILRSSRRLRVGGRRSRLLTLFLLCSSLFLLSVTADDYVECSDPLPDEPMDIPGLMENPVNNVDIRFRYAIFLFLEFNQLSIHPNPSNQLSIDLAMTSKFLPSTVIRI
jgi:hypothetical protein